jgi:L-tyrosine isonitrile synthase
MIPIHLFYFIYGKGAVNLDLSRESGKLAPAIHWGKKGMGANFATSYDSHENPLGVSSSRDLATEILGLVMRHRRIPLEREGCAHHRCAACVAQHLDRILAVIERKEPVVFVLPAFPGKSPNPAKVLGPRPDMAERQSLAFLNALCRRIEKVYPPGARIVLCSDGRVFNDVVGIPESDLTMYQQDLGAMIAALKADCLSTFNLDHVFSGCSFDEMRSHLMTSFGEPIERVQEEVRADDNARRLYCGITRFLLEDALRPNMTISKTALQKQCRRRAYEVIQRSRAWDQLLAKFFPGAVRLSIHPQVCGSRKIGIHLMETQDEWLTAWHSVAVEAQGRFRLMKREHVERLGGELVFLEGRPSHYVVAPEDANDPEDTQWR